MRKKIITIAVSVVALLGIFNFLAVPQNTKYTPKEYQSCVAIENDKLNVKISQSGAVIHTIVFKHFINKDSKAVILNDPINYSNCVEILYPDITKNLKNIVWDINNKSQHEVTLIGKHNNVTIERHIQLNDYNIQITDKKINAAILKQNILINGDGSSNGKFFIINNKANFFNNKHITPNLFNLYSNPNKKIFIDGNKNAFGAIYEENYLIAVKLPEESVVDYFSDNKNVGLQCRRTLSNNNNSITITALPANTEMLKAYELEKCRYYGWFPFFSKPMCLLIDYLTQKWNIYGFFLFILLMVLIYSALLYEEIKKRKKHEAMQKEIKLAEQQFQHEKHMLWQEKVKISKKYGGFSVLAIAMPFMIGIMLAYTTNYAIPYCFWLKFCNFLWIKNLSLVDTYSVFNLYGRLNLNLPNYLQISILPMISCSLSIISMQKIFNDKKSSFHMTQTSQAMIWVVGIILLKNFKAANILFLIFFMNVSTIFSLFYDKNTKVNVLQ